MMTTSNENKGLKIGLDCRMMRATGIGRYIQSLVVELSKIDQDNEYVLFLKKEDFHHFKLPAPNFHKVLADFHWYTLSEQIIFPRLIKKQKLDLMHFPHFNVPLFYRGKFVVTIHDLIPLWFKNIRGLGHFFVYRIKEFFYKIVLQRAVKKARLMIVVSEKTKNDLIDILKVPAEKIFVTYEGASPLFKKVIDERVYHKFSLTRHYFLYVGNAYPHKNLRNLILAFNKLVKEYHLDTQLVLVGKRDYFYQKLAEEAKELNLGPRLVFTDYLNDEELAALYSQASLFIFPSLSEGFGLPPLEAMMCGVPVAASKIPVLKEVLGEAAFYFNPLDVDEMAEKIYHLYHDQNLKNRLILKGYEQVKKYSWAKMAQKTLAIYKKALSL